MNTSGYFSIFHQKYLIAENFCNILIPYTAIFIANYIQKYKAAGELCSSGLLYSEYWLCNTPEECGSQLLRGGRLKSRIPSSMSQRINITLHVTV
jgi:hypothetical protein